MAGASLVAVGLGLAFLVITTPLVTQSLPGSRSVTTQLTLAMLVWVLAVAAGAALLLAGMIRLALAVASVRERRASRSAATRAMGDLSDDILVAASVVLPDGRPIPELVIGPFGAAIVHELEARGRLRAVGQGWDTRTRDGWVPAEGPLEGVARDAERVGHWLANGDLDHVVRVYAALVTTDVAIPRSPLCAVINEDQIPPWLAALPRQRASAPVVGPPVATGAHGRAGSWRRVVPRSRGFVGGATTRTWNKRDRATREGVAGEGFGGHR